MTLTIIIEGSNNAGKTTLSGMIELWFQQLNLNYIYFHDSDLYECVTQDSELFDLEDLINERKDFYAELRDEYDVILLDRSFMSTIIYNLNYDESSYISRYITRELLNIIPTPDDRMMVYVLVRDPDDDLTNDYIELSHILVLDHHVNSMVRHTLNDINRTFDLIKNELYVEFKELGLC